MDEVESYNRKLGFYVDSYVAKLSWIEEEQEQMKKDPEYLKFIYDTVLMARHSLDCCYLKLIEVLSK